MKKRFVTILVISAVMCVSLTGCDSDDYKDAVAYEESGDYEEALAIYSTITDYKDSEERITFCETMISAIADYDTARELADEKNSELDESISNAENLIAAGSTPLDESLITSLETSISNAKAAKVSIEEMPETAAEIIDYAAVLSEIDYTDILAALSESYTDLDRSIRQYALVDAPSESYIIECLQKVENVADISAVTEDNDPNGNLNKAGGYTAQVYFSSDLVDQDSVYGSTIIEKGTDCGGSIEVYATVEDATKREEYLTSFDGTIFASGSHAVVGTVLVRTSDELTASQQKEMEANIISALTSLDE